MKSSTAVIVMFSVLYTAVESYVLNPYDRTSPPFGNGRLINPRNLDKGLPVQHPGGVPFISEVKHCEEKYPEGIWLQTPGYYPQQQITYYTAYQPILEREPMNSNSDVETTESSIYETQIDADESGNETCDGSCVTEENTESTTTSIPESTTTSIPESTTTSIPESTTTSIPESTTTSIPESSANEISTQISVDSTIESVLESEANYILGESTTLPVYEIDSDSSDLATLCQTPRGQFSSLSSCKKFVNCWDGYAVEQDCPASTLWNELGFCDFAERVDCGSRPLPVTVPVSDCSTPYATFRNPQNCSEFFVCVDGFPISFGCPDNLYYNTDLGVCDYPYRVSCSVGSTVLKSPMNYDMKDELYKFGSKKVVLGLVDTSVPCKSNSIQRLSGDCTQVAVCDKNGYSQIVNCPNGTSYDIESGRCIAEKVARC